MEPTTPGWKRKLKRAGLVLGASFAVIGLFFYFATKEIPKTAEELKPFLEHHANRFLRCLEAKTIGSCYYDLTSENFRHTTQLETIVGFSESIRDRLGRRISGAMDDSSFTPFDVDSHGIITKAKFYMIAIYQNDATVNETFGFVFDPKTADYKVEIFKIKSSKF